MKAIPFICGLVVLWIGIEVWFWYSLGEIIGSVVHRSGDEQ